MSKLENRKARFDYDILETYTAGMQLHGWEVKSLRSGHANFSGTWVKVTDAGEAFLENLHISPWKGGSVEMPPIRPRRLLLKRQEIEKMLSKVQEKGYTVIPLKLLTGHNWIKCEIALGKGRKKYEKREVLKRRSQEKEARQAMKRL